MFQSSERMSRRDAMKLMAAAAAPVILPSTVFGANAPSKRLTIGMIGLGRQARAANLPPFLASKDTIVLAVCDVDAWRLQNAKGDVDKHYGNSDCKAYRDWREIVAREDIDAVMVSTPDHWHVPISLAAVRAGKHVSCEKPLTLSVAEGRVLADAVRDKGVVFRTDSECRSNEYMHRAAELVVNGHIGKLKRIEVTVPTGDVAGGDATPMPAPEELDYEMWAGPAPMHPYTLDRVHPRESYGRPGWMRCRDTCEGMITNWGAHLLDVAQWVHGSERTGPVEVEAAGEYPAPGSGLWNVLLHFKARFRYADGVEMDYATSDAPYVRFEGEDGWIQSTWFPGGDLKAGLTASAEALLQVSLKDSDIHLPQRGDKEDFIHGIRTGEPTMADAEIGHRTCSMGQLAHIAIQVGRKLTWDPVREQFAGDEAANALLTRPMRAPWQVAWQR
ncbi:MAG: Gfo/Idh/MocA family oxidoreductase [Candidatus Hydrogenedentes bacterium]|nr:Gfo/Idh/MocA family oxidoreductase [Candidatus Hydrogenedentota bacterium]